MNLEQRTLAPGYTIPRLIKGGWQLAGGHGTVDRAAALADMDAYVAAGLTAFDCADIYTGVEQLIGDWRRTRPDQAAGVRVHTKFVPDLSSLATLDAGEVERLIDRSCARLGVETLDLVQFHWWDLAVPGWVETARTLATLRDRGRIRLLGGTNFDTASLRTLAEAGVQMSTMQVQYSVLDDRPARQMTRWAGAHGVSLLCYGTVAGGFLAERWRGRADPGMALENRSLVKYKLIIDDVGGWDFFQALLDTLAAIAGRHGTDISTIATRYVLEQEGVGAAIVGVRHGAHLTAHLRAASMRLDKADHGALKAVLAQRRPLEGDVYALERDREGRHGRIMKYDLSHAPGGGACEKSASAAR
jgi:aryl-alcohol dehydrogenase-like predicted oxidoreductase